MTRDYPSKSQQVRSPVCHLRSLLFHPFSVEQHGPCPVKLWSPDYIELIVHCTGWQEVEDRRWGPSPAKSEADIVGWSAEVVGPFKQRLLS